MNVSTSLIFFPENESKDICNQVMLGGSQALKQSTKIDKYGLSLREAFGLCVLSAHRAFLNPNKIWAFTTEPEISDDGAIVSLEGNKINYCELIEQVYLPGAYLKRTDGHSMVRTLKLRQPITKFKKLLNDNWLQTLAVVHTPRKSEVAWYCST